MLLCKGSERQCRDHRCICEIRGIRSCKKTFDDLRGSFFTSWITVTDSIPQKAFGSLWPACLQKQKPASESGWWSVWSFFYWAFVPQGMCCNYLHSLYLFTFNWEAKIVLKLSLSNWSGLFLLFLDGYMTSGWTNDTVLSGSKFKPSHM